MRGSPFVNLSNFRVILLLCVGILDASRQSISAETNWKEAAQTDLSAARTTMLGNTPGAVVGVDDAFLKTIDDAYATASMDAAKTTNYEGYRAALERFANTFQDDHVWVDFTEQPKRQWPGFLPGYRDGQFIVASTSDSFRAMANARIVSCDNLAVSDIARRNIQSYVTRWSVPSGRRLGAPHLFVDIGNPFIHRPKRCVFVLNGKTWTQRLQLGSPFHSPNTCWRCGWLKTSHRSPTVACGRQKAAAIGWESPL